jgi:membrane-bound lytic murein transglycosylase B
MMKKIAVGIILLGISIVAFATASIPADRMSWSQWVAQIRKEALAEGINPYLFDQVFQGIKPDKKTLRLEKHQPEKRLTFNKYRTTRGDPYRIKLGVREYKKNQRLLSNINHEFGVSPCIVVSLWGLETSYGRYMGNFPTIKSLATLSYQSRRSAFFHKELLLALHIVNDGHIDNAHFKGEWAGASGQPQFLPSSWYNFAVDYDGDGKKDIWTSVPDVLASISNYMIKNGWHTGEPWAYEVSLPSGFNHNLIGKEKFRPVSEWAKLGVRLSTGNQLPSKDSNLQAAIIQPYGGPYLLVFNNFKVIMRYNNSTFYAGTVGYMADQICRANGA